MHTHQVQHTHIYFTFASMPLYIHLDRYIVKTVSSYNHLCFQSNTTGLPSYNSKHKAASELTTPICIRNTNLITVFAISFTISSQNTVFQNLGSFFFSPAPSVWSYYSFVTVLGLFVTLYFIRGSLHILVIFVWGFA